MKTKIHRKSKPMKTKIQRSPCGHPAFAARNGECGDCLCEKLQAVRGGDGQLIRIGDTVGHSEYVLRDKRDYYQSCGREPYRSTAKADLDKAEAERGVLTAIRQDKVAIGAHVDWPDGCTSDCLSYRIVFRGKQ